MMPPLTIEACSRFRKAMSAGANPKDALKAIAGASLGNGVWRLFSHDFPAGGIDDWNERATWRGLWSAEINGLFFFGEDLFGNQLGVRQNKESVCLWNHENGELVDLQLDPALLFESVIEGGLKWIEFYGNKAIAVAQSRTLDVPLNCHLHWTTPLILGGAITIENTSVVERVSHLVGHAKLWRQIQGLPPGTSVIPKGRV